MSTHTPRFRPFFSLFFGEGENSANSQSWYLFYVGLFSFYFRSKSVASTEPCFLFGFVGMFASRFPQKSLVVMNEVNAALTSMFGKSAAAAAKNQTPGDRGGAGGGGVTDLGYLDELDEESEVRTTAVQNK